MADRAADTRSWIKTAVVLIAFAAALFLAGWAMVIHTTDRMLRADARIEAQNWADALYHNVRDTRLIIGGERPSPDTLAYLGNAHRIGRIREFALYALDGELRLRSDHLGQIETRARGFSGLTPEAADATRAGGTYVRSFTEQIDGVTLYASEAVIPLMDGGRQIGFLQMVIPQNYRRELFLSAAIEGAFTVGVLIALVPIWGFWSNARQKRAMRRQLEFMATHDPLTGLMNRASWLKSFSEAFARNNADRPILTVLAIELSGIRTANETFGNTAGDQLLRVSAERLTQAVGMTGFISRIGGSSFGVIASPLADAIDAAKLAQSIIRELSQPVKFHGEELAVDVSVGVAISPTDGTDHVHLVRAAEFSAEKAHSSGRNNYRFFDAAVEKIAERRRQLERFAGEALSLNALDVHYQPIVDLRDGRLSGFEALLRVNHPELGPVSPADFVAAAENSGEIDRIGAWCIEHCCRAARQWPDTLTLSVNLSPVQFNSGRLIAILRKALEASSFPAYRLELEVTEGIMMDDADFIQTQLRALQEMGVRVAIDDFGTGYSSLSYLWKFPFSRIKIDQTFVRQIEESATAQGIVSTIISLGRSIGVPLTAEGIETEAQLAFLRQMKCEHGQGYLFSRPVPSTEIAALILKNFAQHLPGRRRRIEAVHSRPTAGEVA
jgi:diguanylate cyclase (GGDEF)-like protein